jgi:hypothetical protein
MQIDGKLETFMLLCATCAMYKCLGLEQGKDLIVVTLGVLFQNPE